MNFVYVGGFEWLILEPRKKILEIFELSFREVFATIVCIRSLAETLREDGDVDFSEDVYHLSFSFAKSIRPSGVVNVAR